MLKPFFCEILNRKISIKAAHPQRLSYKLKNTLGSSITWWHLDFVLRFGTEKWPGPWTKSFPVYLKFSNLRAMVYSLRVLIYTFHLIMIFFLSLMKNEFEAFSRRFIVLFFVQTRHTYYAFPACLTSPFYFCVSPVDLVARFSPRVREVPSSNPGQAPIAHDCIQVIAKGVGENI